MKKYSLRQLITALHEIQGLKNEKACLMIHNVKYSVSFMSPRDDLHKNAQQSDGSKTELKRFVTDNIDNFIA